MPGFHCEFKNVQARLYCDRLVELRGLGLTDFDVGETKISYDSKGSPFVEPPRPNGEVSETEVFQKSREVAEGEYLELVKSIRSGGGEIPTPFLDYLRSTGDDIPWLFKDREKLADAIRKADELKGRIKNERDLPVGIFNLIVGGRPSGYGMYDINTPSATETDIDGLVDRRWMRCNEFAIMFVGLGLLLGYDGFEILHTMSGSNIEHVLVKYNHGGRDYYLDPQEGLKPLKKNPERGKPIVAISKMHLNSIYFSEKVQNCMQQRDRGYEFRHCLAANSRWASNLAPDFSSAIYSRAIYFYIREDFDAALRCLDKIRELSFFPAESMRGLILRKKMPK